MPLGCGGERSVGGCRIGCGSWGGRDEDSIISFRRTSSCSRASVTRRGGPSPSRAVGVPVVCLDRGGPPSIVGRAVPCGRTRSDRPGDRATDRRRQRDSGPGFLARPRGSCERAVGRLVDRAVGADAHPGGRRGTLPVTPGAIHPVARLGASARGSDSPAAEPVPRDVLHRVDLLLLSVSSAPSDRPFPRTAPRCRAAAGPPTGPALPSRASARGSCRPPLGERPRRGVEPDEHRDRPRCSAGRPQVLEPDDQQRILPSERSPASTARGRSTSRRDGISPRAKSRTNVESSSCVPPRAIQRCSDRTTSRTSRARYTARPARPIARSCV